MKIMHLTYDMAIGGTEQVIRQLILGSASSKFHHQICCIEGKIGAIGQSLSTQGVLIHCLARLPGFDWRLIFALRKLIKQQQIDILHCHQYTPWVYGWFATWGSKTRVIFTEHGRFFPDNYRRKAKLINKLMAATTAKITAISAATKQALVTYEFLPATKIDIIYNGIEPLVKSETNSDKVRQILGIQPTQRVIGTVARLDTIKNQGMLIEAFAIIAADFPELVLLIVGDGPEREHLQHLTAQLNLTERVIFAGFQNPATDYMALMQIFLLPSLSEGTSMTLLEAMSLAIPCIVSNVGGNAEVITHNEAGQVLPENTAEHLAASIQYYLLNEAAWRHASIGAKKRFDMEFTVKRMVTQFIALYDSA